MLPALNRLRTACVGVHQRRPLCLPSPMSCSKKHFSLPARFNRFSLLFIEWYYCESPFVVWHAAMLSGALCRK